MNENKEGHYDNKKTGDKKEERRKKNLAKSVFQLGKGGLNEQDKEAQYNWLGQGGQGEWVEGGRKTALFRACVGPNKAVAI